MPHCQLPPVTSIRDFVALASLPRPTLYRIWSTGAGPPRTTLPGGRGVRVLRDCGWVRRFYGVESQSCLGCPFAGGG
ncbi:hypothetical protein MTBUT4_620004 [Magnetospirillum sp. UT-4]|nr:hypothetical protein MTBUT4_620004 [Magnetospirillum sp. UT-4]